MSCAKILGIDMGKYGHIFVKIWNIYKSHLDFAVHDSMIGEKETKGKIYIQTKHFLMGTKEQVTKWASTRRVGDTIIYPTLASSVHSSRS